MLLLYAPSFFLESLVLSVILNIDALQVHRYFRGL